MPECLYINVAHALRNLFNHQLNPKPGKKTFKNVVECSRSLNSFINYGGIEQIKNGFISSDKYERCRLILDCPTVMVLANEPHNDDQKSMGRWKLLRSLLNC